ncbi:AzlD domain-containing protein [Nocardioides sp. ChNu-153]|uniref:AzlD domain-containing protein n=1 Tax=unclassified Nocardioides TaxID=2615069 RepID=UPI002404ADB7|nr:MULTISPECIES: AzlD domain-containing protein [unclassified Nocardioides]MDF9715957.1 AzlD domain-containing protein [Nocardioides sp. ChNu-99]MDN7122950.1 AzlD domain-containing protein [Nocardioides sp. ChNu-153]
MSTTWVALLVLAAGSYLLKLAGLSLPAEVLERPVVRRVALALPIALLSALVAVQAVADGSRLVVDARVAGLAVAVVALALRANFLLVVVLAALTAAGLRAAGVG